MAGGPSQSKISLYLFIFLSFRVKGADDEVIALSVLNLIMCLFVHIYFTFIAGKLKKNHR